MLFGAPPPGALPDIPAWALPYARLRELEIHHVDLGAGLQPAGLAGRRSSRGCCCSSTPGARRPTVLGDPADVLAWRLGRGAGSTCASRTGPPRASLRPGEPPGPYGVPMISSFSAPEAAVELAAPEGGSAATGVADGLSGAGLESGVWVHEVGTSTGDFGDEMFVVLSGRGVVTCQNGGRIDLAPGVVGVLHAGDITSWEITETLRKVWIVARQRRDRPGVTPRRPARYDRAVTYTGNVTVGGPADVRELRDLVISKLAVGPYENNAYLLRCTATGAPGAGRRRRGARARCSS